MLVLGISGAYNFHFEIYENSRAKGIQIKWCPLVPLLEEIWIVSDI
jgi:hypothetical protein